MYKSMQSILKPAGIAVVTALSLSTADVLATDALPIDANNSLIELRDGNSVLRSDVLRFNTGEAWFVDGNNTLFTDLYFFNVGSHPAQRELRLEDFDDISLLQPTANQLLFSGQSSIFGGSLNFTLESTLVGGEVGSHQSRREDVIEVSFTGNRPLDFTLFSYIDYDLTLDGRFDNDTLYFRDNTFTQTDESGLTASLTSLTHTPTAVELEEYPFLISRLYDDSRTTLNHTSEPLVKVDGTAALQFDETLQSGETLTFKFVKQIQKKATSVAVPEPTLLLALGVVIGGLGVLRRP